MSVYAKEHKVGTSSISPRSILCQLFAQDWPNLRWGRFNKYFASYGIIACIWKFVFLLQAIEKYCQFPPSGSNPISVTTEDYYCLEDESFLNDVIIDFFFKWLQFDLISPEDRDRTHIFSTFFYNRLTTRPQMQVLHSSKVKLRKSPLTLNLLLKY